MKYTLYLDESGDHDLINIDKNYPIFVLAGCVLPDEHYDKEFIPAMDELKEKKFNTKDIVLHYRDYTRDGVGFERMSEVKFREDFYEGLNEVISKTKFMLIGCVIDKVKHKKHYVNAMDPYLLSLTVIIERFVNFLKGRDENGIIIAESRSDQLDNELQLAFLNLKINGTSYLTPKEISDRIGSNFFIKKKGENIAGLQLVDSVVTPIGRRYLELKNRYINYDLIKSKFRKAQCGKYAGYGLVILPK